MRRISGHTRPFAVLGHPIGHTLSPVMHNAAYEALGWDAVYLAFDVSPGKLLSVLASMHDMGFAGVNLTVPLKEVAFEGLTRLDGSARLLRAVNTVQFAPDGLTGYNTDGFGFLRAMEEVFPGRIRDAAVFVMGTGGAGRAVALVCAEAGAASVMLADADPARARNVAREIGSLPGPTTVSVLTGRREQVEASRSADLVVHATPVGMKPGDKPVLGPEAFRGGQVVFDVIYNLPETPVMKAARESGAEAANGLGMLLHQGARALAIWTGVEPPVDVMRRALEKAVYPP
jgi:shikimate dehydrogenase